jgi:phosphodiesterase/alkaline phosphatase D-like protein
MLRRTSLCLVAAVAVSLTVCSAAAAKPKGFSYGVASGDVSKNSAILWAHANSTGVALLQLKKRHGYGRCDLRSAPKKRKAKATAKNDLTLQIRIKGLKPGRTYHYRWCRPRGRRSAVGAFDTAPPPGRRKTIRFAVSGDQDAARLPGTTTPYWNDFGVWRRIRAEKNNFNIMLGDTIYSDSEVPGVGGVAGTATSVTQKRAKYRLNLAQTAWAATRGATSYYAHWDDHEFINDFARGESVFPESGGNVEIPGRQLYANGVRAFRDYNPITYSKKNGIYRTFRWGRNLQLFFLDERSFRSVSADYNGNCDNPPGSGSPDLAPTAPAANRKVFSVLIPALAQPPPPGCVAAINDPGRTMLGSRQLAAFEKAIKGSNATFKVIVNEVPIQQFYALPYDRWEGYAAERRALIEFLMQNVSNAVFLTTDVHANMVNDVRLQTLEQGGPVDSGITEVTTGPVATKTFASEINDVTGSASSASLLRALFFNAPPPTGVGMRCSGLDQFSYAEVTVTGSALTVELKDIEGNPVLNTGDRSKPAPPCETVVIPRR